MKTGVLILFCIGLGLFQLLPTSLIGFIEPTFFIVYLAIIIKKNGLKIDLDILFALGQLVVTLSNAQLAGFISEGQSGGMYDYIVPAWISESFHLRFIGSACFLFGYQLLNTSKKWISLRISSDKLKGLFLFSLFVLLQEHFIGFSLPGTFGSLFNWIPLASILYISRIAYLQENATYRMYAIVLMVLSILLSFLFATLRMEMIMPILAYFLGAFLAKPKISFFLSPRFAPFYIGGVFFIVFFIAFGAIRGSTRGVERFTAITEAKQGIEEQELEEKRGGFQRAADLCQITNVVDLTKGNVYTTGETVPILLVSLIPRVFWPAKPKIALGVWFALKIGKAYPTEDGWYNMSINMTSPGHLFLEFGIWGLVLGMLLVGMFYKLMWLACDRMGSETNYLGTLYGSSLLIITFNFGSGADLQIVISNLAIFLILIFLSRIFKLFKQFSL
jgi:hypothetical protein